MTDRAQIDVEWGGENVYVRTNTDAIQVQAFLTDEDADTMHTQLGWAVGEVRRFRQHLADGGHADLFERQPKPGGVSEDEDRDIYEVRYDLQVAEAEVARLRRDLVRLSDAVNRATDVAPFTSVDGLIEALASRPAIPADAVVVTRNELVAGIIVGVGGEHDPVPSQAVVDRAADMIIRCARRRDDQMACQPAPSVGSERGPGFACVACAGAELPHTCSRFRPSVGSDTQDLPLWRDTAGIEWVEIRSGFVEAVVDGKPKSFGEPVELAKVEERYGPLTKVRPPVGSDTTAEAGGDQS